MAERVNISVRETFVMNDYVEVRIKVTPCSEYKTDILAAMLADVGFESFVPDDFGLTAYASVAQYDAAAMDAAIAAFPLQDTAVETESSVVEGRDWNSEWEKNFFQPIVIGEKCVVHSSFHRDFPVCPYDITIDPKMAFGTGHHATTSLIAAQLIERDLTGLDVMDMGTGTGILAILAAMRGAGRVRAIEIDPFAYANAQENFALNNHPEIAIELGDASLLKGKRGINLFMANINRNVITADISAYAATLAPGATVILSGFYVDDIPVVAAAAGRVGLVEASHTEKDRWACLILNKDA